MKFQHTATRRWLLYCLYRVIRYKWFQHTATRRWLLLTKIRVIISTLFQHTATRRWLLCLSHPSGLSEPVSTHSHPKVAASKNKIIKQKYKCFNTQPPEGGCTISYRKVTANMSFNTQPPEGGCLPNKMQVAGMYMVSTHSHPKVAAKVRHLRWLSRQFQHTATRRWLHIFFCFIEHKRIVSTHSHPKVAALHFDLA